MPARRQEWIVLLVVEGSRLRRQGVGRPSLCVSRRAGAGNQITGLHQGRCGRTSWRAQASAEARGCHQPSKTPASLRCVHDQNMPFHVWHDHGTRTANHLPTTMQGGYPLLPLTSFS